MEFKCNYFDSNTCKSCAQLASNSRLPPIPHDLSNLALQHNDWIKCKSPFGLRSKARMVVTRKNDQVVLGILDKNLHGVSLLNCPLHRPIINEALNILPSLIDKFGISIYAIDKRLGELKNIILQTTKKESVLRLRFQLRSKIEIEKIKNLIAKLVDVFPAKIIASANIQAIPHQIAEGEEEIHLYGDTLLWEEYNGIAVGFPAQSFMQVTPEIASRLYFEANQIIKKVNSEKVLDLFCGAGGFALNVAHSATRVMGVDISENAIEVANISAAKNNLTNCKFRTIDLLNNLDILSQFAPDVLICNPPRRGLGEKLVTEIIKNPPETIIYSSCNAESFLKDYSKLSDLYVIKEITPFEMFPLTRHFETLAYLSRIK